MGDLPELRDRLATAPTPLAQLVRRVLNARPGAEHHAAAFYVIEVSLKLAASARISFLLDRRELLDRPFATRLEALLLPSFGHWCSFLADANRALARQGAQAGPLAAVARDLTRALPADGPLAGFVDAAREASLLADDRARAARKGGVIGFFEAVVTYRNQVLGHGALRSPAFYERFASLFRAAIVELLASDALLGGGELALALAETDDDGAPCMRWKSLVGLAGVTLDREVAGVEPRSLHLRFDHGAGGGAPPLSLHPLVICVEDELGRERFGFLNRTVETKGGGVRRADYLDYASGEELPNVDTQKALTTLLGRLRGKEATTAEVLELEATLLADSAGDEAQAAPATPADTSPMVGRTLGGKYVIVSLIGQGGMASVYEARHVDLGERRVAIKVLHADLARRVDIADRFRAEARRMSELEHPGIVDVTDFGRDPDGTAFFVMEKLSGAPLDRWRDLAAPSVDQIVRVLIEVLGALEFAHARGLIHRDLKPQNLFLARDARGVEQAKVLDFGIAKALADDGSATADGMLLGTPCYMSPEQIANPRKVDERADVYSIGATMFQLLTGMPPVEGGSALAVVSKVKAGEVVLHPRTLCPDVPAWLDAVVARAMALDPAARFASALDMRRALEAGAEQQLDGITARPSVDAALARSIETPIDASSDDGADRPSAERSLAAQATTVAGVEAARAAPGFASRWLPAIAIVGAIGVAAALLVSREPGDEPPDVVPTSPAQPADAGVSAPAPLREPVLGSRAIASYHDPKGAGIALLNSASFWESAQRDFESAAQQPGAPLRWRAAEQFCRGEQALQLGDLGKAEAALREAGKSDPSWAVPLVALASVLSRAGKRDAAMEAVQNAERLEPSWVGAMRTEGVVHAHAGEYPEAIQAYRRALALAPADAITLGYLALAYHASGLDSESQRYGKQALEVDPDQAAVRLMLAEVALERPDATEALDQATRAAAIDPNQASILLARADALALLGRKEDALDSYRSALAAYRASGERAPLTGRLLRVSQAVAKGELPPARRAAVIGSKERTANESPVGPRHVGRTACPPGDPLCGVE